MSFRPGVRYRQHDEELLIPAMRLILISLASVSIVAGTYAFATPAHFFDLVPGLSTMGPYNVHLVRDVAIALAVSGAVMLWGAASGRRSLALAGTAWPVLHALFHLQIWAARGFPFDRVAAFAVPVLILLPFVALWAAANVGVRRARN